MVSAWQGLRIETIRAEHRGFGPPVGGTDLAVGYRRGGRAARLLRWRHRLVRRDGRTGRPDRRWPCCRCGAGAPRLARASTSIRGAPRGPPQTSDRAMPCPSTGARSIRRASTGCVPPPASTRRTSSRSSSGGSRRGRSSGCCRWEPPWSWLRRDPRPRRTRSRRTRSRARPSRSSDPEASHELGDDVERLVEHGAQAVALARGTSPGGRSGSRSATAWRRRSRRANGSASPDRRSTGQRQVRPVRGARLPLRLALVDAAGS